MASTEALPFLYQAMGAKRGLVLRVSDFKLAQARLYAARRESGDPSLSILQIRRSPTGAEDELWLVKQGALPAPSEPEDPVNAPPA